MHEKRRKTAYFGLFWRFLYTKKPLIYSQNKRFLTIQSIVHEDQKVIATSLFYKRKHHVASDFVTFQVLA